MPTDQASRRINDILKNIASIEAYTQGLTARTLQDNQMAADAVERCLERIAEAARKLGPRFDKVMGGDVDLHALRQFGSVMRHDYDTVDPALIWNVIAAELPKLKAAFQALQKDHPLPERAAGPDFDPF
ncbi:MAG: HepT-like ribonuclease domain-containing protein [Alphaproteobacteria bacterium]